MYVSAIAIGQKLSFTIRVMGLRVLAALLALHAAALYLFTTGFFLTRFEVSDLSSCHASPSDTNAAPTHLRGGNDDLSSSDDGTPEGCWMPRRFRRVVFVVIDALRFDFAATGSSAQQSPFYSDRLPVLNETLTSEPEHALLLKFVADPPTMTMQRLKGLTTGSLPTFLDIKDNMAASSQIVEDNLLRQLRAQQRGVVFMGDDTWESLYSREFTRKFAFDSFNVKDLHSVDRGVTAHLFPELQKPDWDLLIAHFLGVDHVGHTHGPSSVFMAEKLDEMNGVLKKLLETLREMPDGDDVLLAVLGDHGMSADGNHGGASDEETGAALFLYSKAALVATGRENDNEDARELKKYAERILDSSREVPQVDLVPTLALLSGLPIPFGNLGSIIPSLFFVPPTSSGKDESSALAAFQTMNRALRLNLDQVRRYLFRYSSASKLPERAYDQLERIFMDIQRVEDQLEQVQGGEVTPYSKADLPLLLRLHEDLAKQQQSYLREALSLGRSIWTQFDLCSMGWGMALLVWVFLIGAISTRVASAGSVQGDSWSPPLVVVTIVGGLLFICPASVNLPLLPAAPLSRGLVAASCTVLITMTWHLLFPRKSKDSTGSTRSSISAAGVVAAVIVVLHALALLSNSYIVAESNVMQFLSATTGFFLLTCAQRLVDSRNIATGAALAFILATRLSSALEPPNIIKTTATLGRTFAPLAAIALIAVASSVQVAKYTGQQLSLMGRLIFLSSMVSYFLCATFWALSPIQVTFWRLWLPRFVYLIFLATLLCLLVRVVRQPGLKHGNALTRQMTSEHLLLLWQLLPAFMLVLGPTAPLSVLCLVIQSLSFSFIVECCRPASGDVTPWVLLWASCSYQAFFTTGHANTFTSLQNAAGFVGFDTFNFYIAGALLGLNTFGCLALSVLALSWLNLKQHQPQPKMLLAFSAYFSLNALVSTLFVALQRRHLMVWAIFAPKFIFDGVVLLVTEFLLLLLLAPFSPSRSQESIKAHRSE
ncbi:Type I phosphodiesterase / nucleotide pyrophosphatase [Phytophthora infestans]|uniref:Type I phosphodiesterase / nucleotide pyrophosphatase n=1 Tax=Phytophthora infestans TaxID=4787 RepID=A0A8S9TZC1_PHYIN|nr:Type I phosphodiesterase / nucleotide pyrophosphatase [Phytophthora infestans]